MKRFGLSVCVTALLLLALAPAAVSAASAEVFTGSLNAAAEVPPVNEQGTGGTGMAILLLTIGSVLVLAAVRVRTRPS